MAPIITDFDSVIIGAGLTGLSTAVHLTRAGRRIAVLEHTNRVGGQIQTHTQGDFTFESGPNTGSGAADEVIELFDITGVTIEYARKEAESRLIWKGNRFHPLPSSLMGGIRTPLFTWYDKFRILGEPWRPKGVDPDENIADMVVRRLGRSYLDYAVDPFLSGIYAGDAHTLVTRHALPKLYNLEQNYGSFIRGSISKAKDKKRSPLATPKPKGQTNIFSARGGLERLSEGMARYIGHNYIHTGITGLNIKPEGSSWIVTFCLPSGESITLRTPRVITTVGAYALPSMCPFLTALELAPISTLTYAPIIQVAVGVKDTKGHHFPAFGGLIGSREKKDILGILFPSSCFSGRAPEEGLLMSFFMGGVRHRDLLDRSDGDIEDIVIRAMHHMLGLPESITPDMLRIFRHTHAIPQYEVTSEERFHRIDRLQRQYPGLIIAGNLRDGIGMAHRIIQGKNLAEGALK